MNIKFLSCVRCCYISNRLMDEETGRLTYLSTYAQLPPVELKFELSPMLNHSVTLLRLDITVLHATNIYRESLCLPRVVL